jgi:hypothetical protein
VTIFVFFGPSGGGADSRFPPPGMSAPSAGPSSDADLRARSGLTTEQLIYRGRAERWLVAASLES